MILNNAKDIKLGSIDVDKVYVGTNIVWERHKGLPPEYQQVEYLLCTGTQYIDTGLKYRDEYYYTVDCEIDDENGNEMFGMDRFDNHSVFIWDSIYRIATDRYNAINTNIPAGQRVNIIIDQSTKTISINSLSHTFTGDFFPINSVYPILLCAYWSSWRNSIDGYGKGKIYSFKYYVSGELVRDMVPCYRKSDGKPGMYDTVTGEFYTNSGTGEFLYGPPAEYRQIEYLGTEFINGKFPYLVLDWQPTGKCGFETRLSQTGTGTLFGRFDYSGNDYIALSAGYIDYNERYRFYYSPGNQYVPGNRVNSGTYDVSLTTDGLFSFGGNTHQFTPIDQSGDWNMFLFLANNGSGTPIGYAGYQANTAFFYYFRGYELDETTGNDILKCNLIPVKRVADNKPGMYDFVTGQFYTSAEPGIEFNKVGPVV